jgi:hypothetical protein
MSAELPDFSAMTRAEVLAWIAAEQGRVTPAIDRAARIEGMRQTAGRVFRERHRFPLGSQERRDCLAFIGMTGQILRRNGEPQNSEPKTEFHTFDFDSKSAAFIEAVAQERGLAVSELLTEAMRIAFWRYSFVEGIKVIENTGRPANLPGAALGVYARIAAAEKALERKITYPQQLGSSLLLLAHTANTIRKDCASSGAELPQDELDRLERAIVATIKTAVALTSTDEADDWLKLPDDYSLEATFPEHGEPIEVHFYCARGELGRVIVPPSVTLDEFHAVADHAAVAFYKADLAGSSAEGRV